VTGEEIADQPGAPHKSAIATVTAPPVSSLLPLKQSGICRWVDYSFCVYSTGLNEAPLF
jgi:hypothetical protein